MPKIDFACLTSDVMWIDSISEGDLEGDQFVSVDGITGDGVGACEGLGDWM